MADDPARSGQVRCAALRAAGRGLGRVAVILLLGALLMAACRPASPATPAAPGEESIIEETEPYPPPEGEVEESPESGEPYPPPAETPPTEAPAPAFPDPESFSWKTVVSGLQKPVDLSGAGDGSGRAFILEQPGRILILKNGELLSTPFLDIRQRVGSSSSEQGLLGIAFHPQYAQNGYFFVNYTDRGGDTVVARFQVSADPDQADAGSERVLLRVEQPYPNHNGGGMAFDNDGYLYISLGDGGSAGDPLGSGQSLQTLLGKLLRIDVNQETGYAIPPDNPFAAGGGLPEIWAYGLRNAWRFSFDRLTGDLYIADVGQNRWEEIDFLPAGAAGGANFGWNYREGSQPYPAGGEPPAGLALVDPVWEYGRDQGCSVTGGYVYRGAALPQMQGIYLFGDYCSGKVWGLLHTPGGEWRQKLLFETGLPVSSFGLDDSGEIYLLDHRGAVLRLEAR